MVFPRRDRDGNIQRDEEGRAVGLRPPRRPPEPPLLSEANEPLRDALRELIQAIERIDAQGYEIIEVTVSRAMKGRNGEWSYEFGYRATEIKREVLS